MTPPSPWVTEHAMHFPKNGRILDLACGQGRHARWLLEQGFRVLAVDRDASAVSTMTDTRMTSALEVVSADLEGPEWPLTGELFDGIVVTRYLYRPRLGDLAELLAPGGVLIYETFMRGNELFGSPRRPEFLLEASELLRFAAASGLQVIDFREGFDPGPNPAMTQSICCRRSGEKLPQKK